MERRIIDDLSVRIEEGDYNEPKVTILTGSEAVEKIDSHLRNKDKNIIDFEVRIDGKILPKVSRVGGNTINEYLDNIKKDKMHGKVWDRDINHLKEEIQNLDLSKENEKFDFSKQDIDNINKVLEESLDVSRKYLKENPSSYFNIEDREVKITNLDKYKENIGRVISNIDKLPEDTKDKLMKFTISNNKESKEKILTSFFENYSKMQEKEKSNKEFQSKWKRSKESKELER